MDAFDLGSVVVQDTATLTISHPITGEPTTWTMQIAGPGHPETVAIANELTRQRLHLEREQEQARVNGRKWKAPDVDAEQQRRDLAQRFARRILGWSPVTMNGEPFAYTRENAVRLLHEPAYGWVATQFYDFVAADAAFIGSSAKG